MAYPVKLQTFEGPLDLLLHLIEQAEVDIYDIPIAEITDQYLTYIYSMQEFKIDIASEFLVMAATLLSIKSRMLLPKHEEPIYDPLDQMEEEIDPREELIQRLIEYKRYKLASEALKEMEFKRNQVYTRPAEDLHQFLTEDYDLQPSYNLSILQLYIAFQSVWKKKQDENRITTVAKEEISVNEKMEDILALLLSRSSPLYFSQLFQSAWSRAEMVVTFLAILELIKQKRILIRQPRNFDEIEIIARVE